MAEWFGNPIMEKLIDTGFEYLKDQVRWQTGLKDELQRLRENHPKIQAVVFTSGQEQIKDQNPALNEWLWQLRDAIDEADDVMDELDYMELQKQVTKSKKQRKVRSIMKSINKKLFKFVNRALKIDPSLKRLEKVVQKLDKVSADVGNFLYLLKDAEQEQQEQQLELYRARETGSLPKNDQIGRNKEKAFVMQWLKNPSNECQTTFYSNISLLSIVGHGGMGKTTLLQHVYKDEITDEFDLKIWVCVSSKFDANRVILDMLESLKNERPRLETLDALQKSLESEVKSKKFLFVLDDIWEEDEERDKSKWEKVLTPLAAGSLGSKILITTRMDSVALMIANLINKKNETLRLEGLEEDECLQLLNRYAFANVENPIVHHKLRSIAEKIAKKLSGSPLVAKVMGGVLNSRLDERHWLRVLSYDIRNQNDILAILKLSYIFLPKPLQNCFAFCSIFPKNYEHDKDDLVRMWIALGFIQPLFIRGETIEDLGETYFDILLQKSLFDKFHIKERTYYKLHDLLYELVRSFSAQECFSIVDDEKLFFRIPKTIRHLFVKTCNIEVLREIKHFKNLRSLYLSYNDNHEDFVSVITEIFKTLRSIRLLYINAPYLKQIPEEIGYLMHLRYLKIVKTSVTLLPRSLSNLFHLQFMIHDQKFLNWIYLHDNFLPRDMNKLLNLRSLKLPFPGMYGIGKLNILQELDGFYIKNEDGYRIGELEHMNELRILRINRLENVKEAKEACNAKLFDKRNLTDLSLLWRGIPIHGSNIDVNLYDEVLDNLQPPSSLKKLKIKSFMGFRSAIWMSNFHLISNLEYIQLKNCLEWHTLPPFGQLPFLKSLYLRNMPKAKRFDYKFHENDKDCVFPSLQVLDIKNLRALEDLFDARAATDDRLFPCLNELYLQDCPNLQEFPYCPPKLEKLEINNIGWKAFHWLQGTSSCRSISIQNLPNLLSLTGLQEVEATRNCQLMLSDLIIQYPSMLLMEPLRSITSLQRLKIEWNDKLVSFSNEVEQWFLKVSSSLCELEFKYLHSLQSLPFSLENLASLKILCVEEVPQLLMLPNIPASLERLQLVELKSLQSLPSSFESLSSIKNLRVEKVPQLQLLPNIPACLELLELEELESLQCLPSSLSFSSLKRLKLMRIPLQKLPNLPPSLCELWLSRLDYLHCLPSCLYSLSSLHTLLIYKAPQLRELPDLPPSLCIMSLEDLDNLNCLPSCLPSLSSLQELEISASPQLQELPNLPLSLKFLSIKCCHPDLKERYRRVKGSDWQKIAHIPRINIL